MNRRDKLCEKCGSDLAPLIIALEPACKVFQYCPCCGTPLDYWISIEAGQKKVLALKEGTS